MPLIVTNLTCRLIYLRPCHKLNLGFDAPVTHLNLGIDAPDTNFNLEFDVPATNCNMALTLLP